jgi:PAS domain-containing protein
MAMRHRFGDSLWTSPVVMVCVLWRHIYMESIKQQPYAYDTERTDKIWQEGWSYIKTVVDTVYDPFLILDEDLRVLAANRSFYRLFKTKAADTEHKYINDLGKGEWNIPALESLLKVILPKHTFFDGFEVNRRFPSLGKKMMVLNSDTFPSIILLAMTDVTEMTAIAEALGHYAAEIESGVIKRTKNLETQVGKLKKDIQHLKKKS